MWLRNPKAPGSYFDASALGGYLTVSRSWLSSSPGRPGQLCASHREVISSSQRDTVAAGRPCAVVGSRVGKFSFATSAGEGKPGTSAGADRFQGFDFPIVTLPRRLVPRRLHFAPPP